VASSAILGETLACAVGAARAFEMGGSSWIGVTFFGDGVCEEGSDIQAAVASPC
jgi:TPP-dependent pyruvate/acetoin dehydrogenase alpha subunit